MFFPLCWLFNYIGVGKACIYDALTECEPVQLKCLQANAQSHKAVPLRLLHSSTRLLMTAVWLPFRAGPSASRSHMPGNTNEERVVPVYTHFKRTLGGMWQRKHQAASRCHLWKSLGHITFKPTCWRKISFVTIRQLPELAMRVLSATWGCSLRGAEKLGGWNAGKAHGGTALGHTD